jgi:tetratricopeptide (TPR) repeat protein
MMKPQLPTLIATILTLLIIPGAPAQSVTHNTPKESEFKALVLVRDFKNPEKSAKRGRMMAELLAAEFNKDPLAQGLRPAHDKVTTWDGTGLDIKVDDVTEKPDGDIEYNKYDVYPSLQKTVTLREGTLPNHEYLVEGSITKVDETWWVRVTLRQRGKKTNIASASERTKEDVDLFQIAAKLVAQLKKGYQSPVLGRRCQAAVRGVRQRITTPSGAAKIIEAMHKNWPDALEPVAARIAVARNQKPKDTGTMLVWLPKLQNQLEPDDRDGQRFVALLGIKPFGDLANIYSAQGKLEKAADTHRLAIKALPRGHMAHWRAILAIEQELGRKDKALEACIGALKHAPDDDELLKLKAELSN